MSDALSIADAERTAIVDVVRQRTTLTFNALNHLDADHYSLFAKESKGAVVAAGCAPQRAHTSVRGRKA